MDFVLRGLQNPVLGVLWALVAGVLASASPCALAALPLVIGHMSGSAEKSRYRDLALFIIGMILSLTLVGVIAGAVGKSLVLTAPWVRWIAGLAFVAAGVAYTGLLGGAQVCAVPLAGMEESARGENTEVGRDGPADKRSVAASFGLGALYGLSASPCSTPALIAILALVAISGSLARGALLLLAYSAGQSALALAAGLMASKFRAFLESSRNARALDVTRKIGGAVIMAVGLYILVQPWL